MGGAIASVSIYRRVKPRVLSKIAATHSLLADLHYVDQSCSRDSPVVRRRVRLDGGAQDDCELSTDCSKGLTQLRYRDPLMKTAPAGKPARPVYLNRRTFSLIGRLTLSTRLVISTSGFLNSNQFPARCLRPKKAYALNILFDIERNQLIAL